MQVFSYTKEELEELLDQAKVTAVSALSKEGLIDSTVAAEWLEEHTIILRKKEIFRTLFDKWDKAEEQKDRMYLIAVKKITEPKNTSKKGKS